MTTRAALAAAEALEARRPIALLHVVAVRGIDGLAPGFHAAFAPATALSAQFGAPDLDARIALTAAESLRTGEPSVQTYAPDGTLTNPRAQTYVRVYIDPIVPTPRLIIVGAGHTAQPLTQFGAMLEFETWVVDDRADYASTERFPMADRVVAAPMDEFLSSLPIDPATYIVLVTRAHRFDEEALRQVLGSPAPYIGMIGSRRRVHIVRQTLLAEGYAAEAFRNVYAPIGLDIGSRTPAEIALAIAAEIVNVRRDGPAPHLSLKEFRSSLPAPASTE